MVYEVISLGSGEIVRDVFNAVAMCLNSQVDGNLYQPMWVIGLGMGMFWALIYAISRGLASIMTSWILPLTIFTEILFVPTATVWVVDPIAHQQHKVDHVPYGLAMTASFTSRIGYGITKFIEGIFSLPDDLKYHNSGMVFASNLVQKAKIIRITNPDLAENMKHFVYQCIAFDVLLGSKYTMQELRNSDNIWQLVQDYGPSPVRSFLWRHPRAPRVQGVPPEIVTCAKGVELFNLFFQGEKETAMDILSQKVLGQQAVRVNPNMQIRGLLSSAYTTLTGMAQNAEDMVQQQMMIYSVIDGLERKSTELGNAPNFAVRRAYLQQRGTYETTAQMAADYLPVMKSTLEAIVYACFIFVVPLSILPMGWRFLSIWVQTLVWLQSWAPLYAILNFVMTSAARYKSMSALAVSNAQGLTIANSVGFMDANADIAATAGFLSMSIPFLSIALIKGAGSFMQLSSSLSGVAQSAAGSATAEMQSGNYSFGNVGVQNTQYASSSMLSGGYAAQYHHGHFKETGGSVDSVTGADGTRITKINKPELPISIDVSHMLSNQYMQAASKSAQSGLNEQTMHAKHLGQVFQHMADLGTHNSRGSQNKEMTHISKQTEESQAFDEVINTIQGFSKNTGTSDAQSADLFASAQAGLSTPVFSAEAGGKLSEHLNLSEIYQKVKEIQGSAAFQTSYRKAKTYVDSKEFSKTNENGNHFSERISSEWSKAKNHEVSASKYYHQAQELREQASIMEQNQVSVNASWTREFCDWLPKQQGHGPIKGAMGQAHADYILAHDPQMAQMYANRFVQEKASQMGLRQTTPRVSDVRLEGDEIKHQYTQEKRQEIITPDYSEHEARKNNLSGVFKRLDKYEPVDDHKVQEIYNLNTENIESQISQGAQKNQQETQAAKEEYARKKASASMVLPGVTLGSHLDILQDLQNLRSSKTQPISETETEGQ